MVQTSQMNSSLRLCFWTESGNDCRGFLLGNTGLISAMHSNDIPDEGEALTSNPLATRRISRKAFKTNKLCNSRQLLEAFAVPKKKKKKS